MLVNPESAQICKPLSPLTAFNKNAPSPKFVKNVLENVLENLSGNCRFSNFRQIFDKFGVPLIGTPENNRQDKFLTNLGFGAFLNAVRGKRVRSKLR